MFYIDLQNEIPVSQCECCHSEIFKNDFVYDLAEVFMGGRCLVHEDCLVDSIEENKPLLMNFLFSDLCLLKDVLDEILIKKHAFDIFEDYLGDERDE